MCLYTLEGAFDTMASNENDVRASFIRVHEDKLDLTKTLVNWADVGVESFGSNTRDSECGWSLTLVEVLKAWCHVE
jgi:hypothetical protein